MDTMRRRVIYMSDTEWAAIREVARNRGQTISACIREQIGLVPRDGWHETPIEKATRDFGEVAADFENAANETAQRFNSRPFTPVPKKGK